MTKTTSPYLDFARNLRTLTENKGAIALVCQELGMNRQQFNKYLSGVSLPAPPTLRKIADYFGVGQHAMFYPGKDHHALSGIKGMHPLFELGHLDSRLLEIFTESLSNSAKTQFREGCYLVYYPSPHSPDDIVKAVMVVFNVGNVTCFRRYSKYSLKERPRHVVMRGRHEGIIIENSGRVFLLAKNSRAAEEISLQSFGTSTRVSNDMICGLALIATRGPEPLAIRVTIDYFGPRNSFKRAMKLREMVPAAASGIPDSIKRSVLEPVKFDSAILLPFLMLNNVRP